MFNGYVKIFLLFLFLGIISSRFLIAMEPSMPEPEGVALVPRYICVYYDYEQKKWRILQLSKDRQVSQLRDLTNLECLGCGSNAVHYFSRARICVRCLRILECSNIDKAHVPFTCACDRPKERSLGEFDYFKPNSGGRLIKFNIPFGDGEFVSCFAIPFEGIELEEIPTNIYDDLVIEELGYAYFGEERINSLIRRLGRSNMIKSVQETLFPKLSLYSKFANSEGL